MFAWNKEYFIKKNEELKIIEKWTKKLQLNWLRKQRDGVIGYVEEKINEIKHDEYPSLDFIEHLKSAASEMTQLNDQIYNKEIMLHSKESEYLGPSSETKKLQAITENESESESENDSENESKQSLKSSRRHHYGPYNSFLKLKPGDTLNGIKYMSPRWIQKYGQKQKKN